MYNLLIGFQDGFADSGRVVEHTEDAVRDYISPTTGLLTNGQTVKRVVDLSRLVNLPTLVMLEIGDRSARQFARVGHLENVSRQGVKITFRFVPHPTIPEIATHQIEAAADALGIYNPWEFSRTHWSVKDVDLYRALHEHVTSAPLRPAVWQFPVSRALEPDLVAVMMPFDASFGPVYGALKEAIESQGLRSARADDIWENHHIMDDVLSLIWRARVVVADLSGKNPNVFYEAGIAHTLGRDVIQIAQSLEDVPFDLRSIRTLTYHNNGEGRGDLITGTAARLKTLLDVVA